MRGCQPRAPTAPQYALTKRAFFDTHIPMTRKPPKGYIARDETFDQFLDEQGLLAEAEDRAIKEMEHLLRSPANAARLRESLAEFAAGGGTERKLVK